MDICQAVIKICNDKGYDAPQLSVNAEGTENEVITWHDNNPNKITKTQIDNEIKAMKDDYASKQYQRDRAEKGYASIGDQLDMQYHDAKNGTTTWKDHVAKVKSDFPKK